MTNKTKNDTQLSDFDSSEAAAQDTSSASTGATAAAKKAVKPWSGHILEWAFDQPGGMLIGALYACAAEREQLLQDMAKELGVTYGYISQLRTEKRSTTNISDKFAHDCAQYLGISLAQVWVLAGRLKAQDLYTSRDNFAKQLANAIEFVGRHPDWGHLLTPALRQADADSQHMVVKLFEAATGTVLIQRS